MQIEEILLRRGIITSDQRQIVSSQQNGHRFDHAVVELGFTTEEELLKALADEFGMEYQELNESSVDLELLQEFPSSVIFRHTIIPLSRVGHVVDVAISDPFDLDALDELRSHSSFHLEPVLARHQAISDLIKMHLGVGGNTVDELVSLRQQTDDEAYQLSEEDVDLSEQAQAASVIRLVNELVIEALNQNASDVHIEPQAKGLTIRYRVDGLLRVQPVPPELKQFYQPIVTRLKIMAKLNIAQKKLPQDGRIEYKLFGRDIDIRVSIIPMLYGEGVVLRLLDKERMDFSLTTIGLPQAQQDRFEEIIGLPHGIFLVTGPTGSGKTTTLYCALSEMKNASTKIITVEDPVEYHLDGISQIQVHSKIGLTFASSLRSILRHDPDVILIGEIRDYETAESAIQASLTGHLVFSTLHTNDAASAFTRLIDMGVEPYLAASTVEGVMAQRLIRVLCPHCKEAWQPDELDVPKDFPRPLPEKLYRPVGCRKCRDIGYAGRRGIFELLKADEGIRQLCHDRAGTGKIRTYAMKQGMKTLRQSGWEVVIAGETSIEEVLRITKGDI